MTIADLNRIDRQIAALRAKTTANGCTPAEAAAAVVVIEKLEATPGLVRMRGYAARMRAQIARAGL